MRIGYATKDQMKVWQSATKPAHDGHPEIPTTRVMLLATKEGTSIVASLTATDGYQLMRRYFQIDPYLEISQPIKIAIPSDAIKLAEKAMKINDRAYLDSETNKIVVVELSEDENGEELERTTATVPYVHQLDMFMELESGIEKAANQVADTDRVIELDARILQKIVKQLKSGPANVYITIRMQPGEAPMLINAFDEVEDERLIAVVMPLQGSQS